MLDAILARYMEQNQSSSEIVAAGFDSAAVQKITRLIQINEYKRRQAPPGVRIPLAPLAAIGATPLLQGQSSSPKNHGEMRKSPSLSMIELKETL